MKTLLSYRNFISLLVAAAVLLATFGFTFPAAAQSSCGATYTVQRGDYLTKIARACGVSYSDLLKANPTITNPSLIFTGQILNIPSGSSPVAGSNPGAYTVQKGDTLISIGQHFNVSISDLREVNPNLNSTIVVGQVLVIPVRIRFAVGSTGAVVQGHLGANSKQVYLLNSGASQTLEVTLSGPSGLTLAIMGADGNTIQSASTNSIFRGVLTKAQDYVLVVASGSAADYGMTVDIPERIRFASGAISETLIGTVPANLSQFFILNAAKGQTLKVTATPDDKLQLIIYGFDGSVLRSGMGQGASFSGVLPSTQDYFLVLRSTNQVQSFTLVVSIPSGTTAPVTGTNSYTVQSGDTLLSIAMRFHTSVNALLRANPDITNKNVIPVGQVIYLPGATLTLSNGKIIYIANTGDSLLAIARQFNVTLTALISVNPQISNPNLIYTGQRININ
jgi:LysM repeat protein